MITRTRLTMAAIVLVVALATACGDNGGANTKSAAASVPQRSNAAMPEGFDDALAELEGPRDDLEAGPHRTDVDYRRFCTDTDARSAELELRQLDAAKDWYLDLAESTEPMREITDEETQAIYTQIADEFDAELEGYRSLHPEVECTT